MGMTKALMEKILIAKSRTVSADRTLICGTRYGNVMGSRGSVIPLLIEQIKNGQPLTVTDPNMTSFLMSLDEAVNLVLYAFKNANSGDIFVQKSPSCYIGDLAKALKELFNVDNEIKIIGIRHGEKMYEVLLTKEEAARAIDEGNYYRIPSDNRDLNYEKYLEKGSPKITLATEYNSNNTKILTVNEIKEKLLSLDWIREELHNWEARK